MIEKEGREQALGAQLNKYRFNINDSDVNVNQYHHKDNKVKTTKYNCITLIPKALLFQFMRLANIYFLVCAIIQCIPAISPLGPATAIVPLLIVLSVSIIREGYEDYKRGKLDKEQNSEPAESYRNNQWENVKSGDLKIGELVYVVCNRTFPSDLILIDSSLGDGSCFIETGSLDGEKTLKMKNSHKDTANKFNFNGKKVNNINISGDVVCDHPNPELYLLNGKMHLNFEVNDGDKTENGNFTIPLDAKQLLLKGAKLKNTDWIIGIVCYTGHNCKIMKNAKEPRIKYSSVEFLMNEALVFILILQAILCIICAVLRGIYYNDNLKNIPLKLTEYSYGLESFLSFFTYLLLLNTMIPISLIITLEIVKLIQGKFMNVDSECYSRIRCKRLNPNSVSLNEELGLVNYIFTDKTGTLTCNKMSMKFCVIGDICYEIIKDDFENNKAFRKKETIATVKKYEMYRVATQQSKNSLFDIIIYQNYSVKSNDNSNIILKLDRTEKLINEFWTALAVCHDCTIQGGKYIGMSPDNIELVKTAKFQGFSYEISELNNKIILYIGEKNNKIKKVYNKVCQIEFSSERKRESVIIKEGNIYKLYIKGADNIIEERLNESTPKEIINKAKYYVNLFSSKGYRTLFVAMRILSEKEYENFSFELNKAKMDTEKKNEKISLCYEMVESNLTLIGATIVEDKLQENVPEVIKDLRLSGIKIWMLTGDKLSTAYNIGLSCNLISKDMKVFKIEGKKIIKNEHLEDINKEERIQTIVKFIKEFSHYKGYINSMDKKTNLNFSILIDENALFTINESEEISKMFLNVAKDAITVICCRVSPLQKSQVIKMMKNYDKSKITLAIGDGGNDVSMIMEAHIGIGIYGEEGMRAVQSSDYAIGEFKILHRLLLFHGRTDYIRNSECIQYFFYKNFVFTLVQFAYGFINNFSGQTIIDDWYITLFNLLFTSLPLGARACLDIDVKPSDGIIISKMLPFLYKETRDYPIFNIKKFLLSLLKGLSHCAINYYFVIYIVKESCLDKKGNEGDLWFISVNLFTNILIIVSIDLLVYTRINTYVNALIMLIITFIAYIIFLIIVHNLLMFNSNGTMIVSFSSATIWVDMLFTCGTCFVIEFATMAFNFFYFPSLKTTLQVLVKKHSPVDDETHCPPEVIQNLRVYDKYNEEKENKKDNEKNNEGSENVDGNNETVRIEDGDQKLRLNG